jgi:hypothetical protein
MPWREEEFTDAFDYLVARHPALRSSFELNQHSAPVQVVRSHVSPAFDVVTGARDADVEDYVAARHTQRYGFNYAPLYSCAHSYGMTLWICFAFHHAILMVERCQPDTRIGAGLLVPPRSAVPPIDWSTGDRACWQSVWSGRRSKIPLRKSSGVARWMDRMRRRWIPASPLRRHRPPIRL